MAIVFKSGDKGPEIKKKLNELVGEIAGSVADVEEAVQAALKLSNETAIRWDLQPNLFSELRASLASPPDVFAGMTASAVQFDGLPAIKITSTVNSSPDVRWVFSPSSFPSGKISFGVTLAEIATSNDIAVMLMFRDASNNIISISQVDTSNTNAPKRVSKAGVIIPPGTVNIYFAVSLLNAAIGDSVTIYGVFVSDGSIDTYRPTFTPTPVVNAWPYADMALAHATPAAGTVAIESGEFILDMSGLSGANIVTTYRVPAGRAMIAGATVVAAVECLTDIVDGGDITLYAYNAAGSQIAASSPVFSKVPGVWAIISQSLKLPEDTASIGIRFVCRPGAAVAKYRRPRLTSDSPLALMAQPYGSSTPTRSPRSVYIAPSGSSNGDGTKSSPLATLNQALAAIHGDGTIYVLPGVYGASQRINPTLCTGHVSIIGIRESLEAGDYAWPEIRFGNPVTGITKTAGRTKIYQATVSDPPSPTSFQWAYQAGVPDPRTLIAPEDESPQHRGRTHRIMRSARLLRASASTLVAALDEMDANPLPLAYIDGSTLYFTCVDGADGTDAEIYLDASAGLVSPATRGSCGSISIIGVVVTGGGVDLTPFRRAHLDEIEVLGARGNAVDYNVLTFGTLEVCCAGSRSASGGDGLNGHYGAMLPWGNDLYSHDNNDDGFSDHEGSSSRLFGGLVENNGGAGICPAYGADHISRGVVSRRNQRRSGRKPGAFAVAGDPTDGGSRTLATFIDCIDIESRTSFYDDEDECRAICINCKSIRPSVMGFNVYKTQDCGYIASGTSVAKASKTTVENTTIVE